MESIIYHYTEYIALNGILNNGIIHLNNILTMNDASEMRYFIETIIASVVKRLKENNKTEEARRLEVFIENEFNESYYYSAYAACFSEHRDDAAQWERYGKSGRGVCIGFDEQQLRKIIGTGLSLEHVFYHVECKNNPIAEKLYAISERSPFEFDEMMKIMNALWQRSAVFKHPSFSSEKEVRLVVSPLICESFAVEPHYNISQNRIKKFYRFDLKAACKRNNVKVDELVTEIIIGPTSTQSKELLSDYFSDCGLKKLIPKITYSECPLKLRFS